MADMQSILLVAGPSERRESLRTLLAEWPMVTASSPPAAKAHLARPDVVLIVAALPGAPNRALAELRQMDCERVRPILFVTSHLPPDPPPPLVDYISARQAKTELRGRVAFLLEVINQGQRSPQKLLEFAHELNNMLTVTLWNLDLLARSGGGSEKDQQRIETAIGGALRCAGLIRTLIPAREDEK